MARIARAATAAVAMEAAWPVALFAVRLPQAAGSAADLARPAVASAGLAERAQAGSDGQNRPEDGQSAAALYAVSPPAVRVAERPAASAAAAAAIAAQQQAVVNAEPAAQAVVEEAVALPEAAEVVAALRAAAGRLAAAAQAVAQREVRAA
jgi:hypothetical protein